MQSWISSQAQGLWIALQSSGILQVCSRVLGCLGWLPGSCRSCCTSQSFSSPSPSSHHCRLCCVPCLVCKVSHLLFPHVPCRFERFFRLRHPGANGANGWGIGLGIEAAPRAKLRRSHRLGRLGPIRPTAPAAVLRSHREGGTRTATRGAGAAEEAPGRMFQSQQVLPKTCEGARLKEADPLKGTEGLKEAAGPKEGDEWYARVKCPICRKPCSEVGAFAPHAELSGMQATTSEYGGA